ncbi:MAG: TonB-dependent receptor [Paludibacter sp.]
MMKLKKLLNVVALLFVGIVFANAETTVMGTVTDASGEALIGVSVKIKGTAKGTITDINGKFGLSVPGTYSVLAFSYIGYESQEVKVGVQNKLTVIMNSNSKDLDEVVVVGYQEIKKRDLTGSVGKADLDNMLKMNVSNVDQALAGRVAGVLASSNQGTPGEEMNIVIRGTNSITGSNAPLYVIDGFPMEDGTASTVNPRDIESMEVLKDASATAIYGARGSNGVIIITTKKGQVGAPVITYDGSFGIQRTPKQMPVLSTYEFVKLQQDVYYASAPSPYFSTDANGKKWTLADYENMPSINWEKMVFRDAPIQNHSLMISGGKEDSRYTASLSYFNQDGIIKNTNYNRMQGKISNTIKKKDLTIYLGANYSRGIQFGSTAAGTLFSNVWGYRPAVYPNQSNDAFLNDIFDESMISDYRVNPLLSLQNEFKKTSRSALQTNGYLQYEFTKGLLLKASVGFTNEDLLDETYNNSNTRAGNKTTANRVNATENTSSRQTWLNENTLTYTKSFDKTHNINALVGYTMQASDNVAYLSQTIQIPSESETLVMAGMGTGTPFTMTSSASRWTMMSYLGRVNYNYKNRYYATASFRADGSSRFKGDNQFGYFPSGSLAWNFTEEHFMKPISNIFSSGKFRLSWGVTGNNRVGDFDTYAKLTKLNSSGVYPFDNSLTSVGFIPSTLGNPNLRWESTSQWNAGTDISFLNQRLFLTLDVYKKSTDDLLLNANLPYSSGYTSGYKNIGKTENRGIEITLKTINIKTKDFTWSTSFNISFNQNKVVSLTENQISLLSSTMTLPNYYTQIGYPLGLMYGYVYEGTYKYKDFNYDELNRTYTIKPDVPTFTGETTAQPGFPKYRDLNGDGQIDSNDQTVIGRGTPIHFGGFINDFTYKGFNLSIFFQWSYGNDIMSGNLSNYQTFNGRTLTNLFTTFQDHWSPENPDSDIPVAYRPDFFQSVNQKDFFPKFTYFKASLNVPSNRIIQDGSFLRLKNITLSYNLSSKIVKILKLSKVRLFVNANDIWLLTGYKGGYDPEVSIQNSALTPGYDSSSYPRALSMNGGVSVSF